MKPLFIIFKQFIIRRILLHVILLIAIQLPNYQLAGGLYTKKQS